MRAQPVTPMRAGFPDPAEIEGRVRASTIDKDPENSSSGIQGDESFITLIKDAGVATTNGTFATVENQLGEIIANFVSNKVKQLCSNAYRNMPAVENNEISIPEIVPEDSTSFAAVVMVDVSGYSNLTASLAERGPVGAAILSKIMKGYLDSIIELIIKNGGDIVKFVGNCD